MLEKLQRNEEALEAYEQALHLEPKIAHTWYRKGNVLDRLGRVSDAQICYEQARQLGFTPKPGFSG